MPSIKFHHPSSMARVSPDIHSFIHFEMTLIKDTIYPKFFCFVQQEIVFVKLSNVLSFDFIKFQCKFIKTLNNVMKLHYQNRVGGNITPNILHLIDRFLLLTFCGFFYFVVVLSPSLSLTSKNPTVYSIDE